MKPLITVTTSFWAAIVLIALFLLGDQVFEGMYIGTAALLICLIFLKNTYAGKVARIYFIVSLILMILLVVALVVMVLVFDVDLNDIYDLFGFDYEFPFLRDQEVEAFANLFRLV